MKTLKKTKPKDVIALVAITLIVILKLNDVDGQLDMFMALILGYYFAHRADGTDNGV